MTRCLAALRTAGGLAIVLVVGGGIVGPSAAASFVSRPVIRSVSVGGAPARPVFTISGHGLTVPAPSPKVSPSNQPGCPVKINGNAGFDYGTQFYVDAFATGTGEDKQLYAAGRYRPGLNETDCIGLVVLSHSPTRVRFTFGSAYTQFRSQYRTLRTGDLIEVVFRGAAYGLVVRYR
jgi:hypothetical protein